MRFPLDLRFRLLSVTPQLEVKDADGRTLLFVRQKLFRLREAIEVFADAARTTRVCTIEADRVLDFSARYTFRRGDAVIGSIKREGMRSLWRAHYRLEGGAEPLTIHEANPWAKAADALVGDIPVLGLLSGFLFHPAYHVERRDGTLAMRLVKQPTWFESRFAVEAPAPPEDAEATRILLGLLVVVLLERRRG